MDSMLENLGVADAGITPSVDPMISNMLNPGAMKASVTPTVSSDQPPSNAYVAANAANKAIAAIPDAFLNAPTNVLNLGKAVYGTAATALGRAYLAPDLTPTPDLTAKLLQSGGFTNPAWNPQTMGQRLLSAGVGGAMSGLAANPASTGAMLSNMATSGISGVVGQGTTEATGNPTLGAIAGMAAVPVTSAATNAMGKAAQASAQRTQILKSRNAVNDDILAQFRKVGYVTPPSEVNPSAVNQVASWPSGKIMTQQAASVKNQLLTDDLARQDLGIPKSEPLTASTFRQVSNDAVKTGYEPLKSETFKPTAQYQEQTGKIFDDYRQMVSENPSMKNPDVEALMKKMDVGQISGKTAIAMTRDFRNDASKAFRSGDNQLGGLYKKAAGAVEDMMQQNLQAKGSTALQDFKDARQLIAKSHDYENALTSEGGHIDGRELASIDEGQLTGNAKIIANFAAKFNKSAQPISHMQQLTALDNFIAGGVGIPAGMYTHSLGGLAAGLAVPASRLVSRAMILSNPYQNAFAKPSYPSPSFMTGAQTTNPLLRSANLGGLLSQQQ